MNKSAGAGQTPAEKQVISKRLPVGCSLFDQRNNRIDGILLIGIPHCINEGSAIVIKFMNGRDEGDISKLFLFKHHAEALTLKRTGV